MISIIVPIYKVEKYLPQCVDSLTNQTYKDIEIILVDDGSPDRCPEICDNYAFKDQRVKVIHQKNAGVSAARNAGLRIASGEYFGFADPDDWTRPEMYENMLNAMEYTQTDMAICGYEYFDKNGKRDDTRCYPCKEKEVISQKEVMKRLSDIPPSVRHVVWNKVFKRSLLKDLQFKEGMHSSEDVLFLSDYVVEIQSAVVVHQPYYCNRVRDGSATHGGLSIHSLAQSFQAHEYMYHAAIKAYPDLKQYSQTFLLDVYLLKYNEAKRKAENVGKLKETDASDLKRMRKAIHAEGRKALFNSKIYWKTRLAYLLA